MKVATWRGGPSFSVDDEPDPKAGPGEAVVRIHTCGICGTEVHATQGLFPFEPPMVFGHEFSGEVVEVGEGVDRALVGREVACEHTVPCG